MTKLLILIVVVLGILAVAQLARVYELTSKLVPAAVYPRLNQLTWPNYAHKYYVDGTPVAADAQLTSSSCTPSSDATKCWRTIVTGGLNSGGQGVYTLNVTDPSTFASGSAKSLVLWEFNDRDDPDLGYTFAQPIVRKMNNGKWAVIFGNGYNNTDSDGRVSTTGDAYLYIVYVDGPGYDGTGRGQSWTVGTNYHKIQLPAPNAGAAPLSRPTACRQSSGSTRIATMSSTTCMPATAKEGTGITSVSHCPTITTGSRVHRSLTRIS